MSLKFTKCGVGSESGDESLLFEFLDQECPEFIELEWVSELVNHKFIGSLQTHQHQGVFLEPITFNFKFFGAYIDANNNPITAKRRFDQLARLQGRVIKFWFEGIKQLVIIKNCKVQFHNYQHVSGSLTLAPHDLQVAIKPTEVHQFKMESSFNAQINVDKTPDVDKAIKDTSIHVTEADVAKIKKDNLNPNAPTSEVVTGSKRNTVSKSIPSKERLITNINSEKNKIKEFSKINVSKPEEKEIITNETQKSIERLTRWENELKQTDSIRYFSKRAF